MRKKAPTIIANTLTVMPMRTRLAGETGSGMYRARLPQEILTGCPEAIQKAIAATLADTAKIVHATNTEGIRPVKIILPVSVRDQALEAARKQNLIPDEMERMCQNNGIDPLLIYSQDPIYCLIRDLRQRGMQAEILSVPEEYFVASHHVPKKVHSTCVDHRFGDRAADAETGEATIALPAGPILLHSRAVRASMQNAGAGHFAILGDAVEHWMHEHGTKYDALVTHGGSCGGLGVASGYVKEDLNAGILPIETLLRTQDYLDKAGLLHTGARLEMEMPGIERPLNLNDSDDRKSLREMGIPIYGHYIRSNQGHVHGPDCSHGHNTH